MAGRLRRTRVLVVSHEARRTGAPRVAIEIVTTLRSAATEVVCVLRGGGPLTSEFAAAADRLGREPFPRARALFRRVRWLRPPVDRLDEVVALAVLAWHRPAVAYLNTVKAVCYVRPALRLGIPVVLHVHELEPLASTTLRRCRIGERWRDVHLVACSTAARDNLARVLGVPVDDVAVVPSPVDVDAVVAHAGVAGDVDGTADSAPSTFTVGACGTVNRRKGVDLWLGMVRAMRARRPELDVRFVWIGRDEGAARRLGHRPDDDTVEFVGEVANPYALLAGLDVFTLPSREDPFPLVVLEAMALSRPVAAFDVGGLREQLGDAGVLVAPERPSELADAVIRLLEDPAERRRLGTDAAQRVRALYDVETFRPAIRAAVRAAIGQPLASRLA